MPPKTKQATPAPIDLADAYGQALDHVDAVSHQSGCDEPIVETGEEEFPDHIAEYRTTHPSPLHVAQEAARAARTALHNAHGPTAVALAEARAKHRRAAAALARAETPGAGGGDLAQRITAEAAASRQARALEPVAARAQQAYTDRLALDARHPAELAQATTSLEAARQALTEKAAAAELALFALVAAADAYSDTLGAVAADLSALGFTGADRYDGTPHDTTSGPVLRVAGTPWPRVDAAELLPRALMRVADAVGERPLRDRLLGLCGVRGFAADALLADVLLADVPEPVRVARKRIAPVDRPALMDVLDMPKPGLREHGGYHKTTAPKRRIFKGRRPAA